MLDVLIKGIGVGVAVAAPVGPIGLLCIKRTLADGRASGLASGLGAASADAVYGFMVAAGLAATGILVSYAEPMTLFGGIMIAILGLFSIRAFLKGAGSKAKPAEAKTARGLIPAFATTFALTISNPMTILAFVALVTASGLRPHRPRVPHTSWYWGSSWALRFGGFSWSRWRPRRGPASRQVPPGGSTCSLAWSF